MLQVSLHAQQPLFPRHLPPVFGWYLEAHIFGSSVPLSPIPPIPFPYMYFGTDITLSNYTDTYAQRAISHECLTSSTSYYTNSLPQQYCLRIRSQVFFPSCWDGVNLDSADHSSHVSHAYSFDFMHYPLVAMERSSRSSERTFSQNYVTNSITQTKKKI
jgi:hypothetical protein